MILAPVYTRLCVLVSRISRLRIGGKPYRSLFILVVDVLVDPPPFVLLHYFPRRNFRMQCLKDYPFENIRESENFSRKGSFSIHSRSLVDREVGVSVFTNELLVFVAKKTPQQEHRTQSCY